MKNIRQIIYLLLCLGAIVGILSISSCRQEKKVSGSLDSYRQFYSQMLDSMSKNSSSVCEQTRRRMQDEQDSTAYYHYAVLLAKAFMFMSEIDSANYYVDKAERYCHRSHERSHVTDLYAEVYNMRGNVWARQGQVDSAVSCFNRAYDWRMKGGEHAALSDISLNLADAYVRMGRYDYGAYWYRKALYLYDSLHIPESNRFPAYYGLAQVYMELREFALCDQYYDMAAGWYDKMLPYEQCIYLNNRGNSYYFRKDYDRALDYFRAEHHLAQANPELSFEEHLSEVNMGETFMLMGKTDSAAYYLDKCYDFFHSMHNKTALYYLETQLIELALKQGDLPLARKRLEEAVQPDCIEPNMLHIRNRYLQHYYEETGDFRQAYYYQCENQRIDDSTRNERIRMRTAEIDLKYKQDTLLMHQRFSLQQKENEVLELSQQMFIWVLGSVCVVIAISFFYWYKKKKHYVRELNSRNMISMLRLENIRNRISPHFIFNVLNHEMSRYTDEQEATNMRGLVKLMRRNLELTGQLCVTIAEELDFVRTYVDLERKALGKDFVFNVQVDERIDTSRELLPSMIIQIPVENAIKHALMGKEGKKCLWISVLREKDSICIRVCDNGGGYRAESQRRGTGTGMRVLFQTMHLLNANNKRQIDILVHDVAIEGGEQGCEFVLTLPDGYDYNLKRLI